MKRRYLGLCITGLMLGRSLAGADPVLVLATKLARGEAILEYRRGPLGYLPSLLKNLGILQDSQALVFSKTSFQAARISPQNPRAIYFNDSISVGFVPDGDVLEILSLTPEHGLAAYTLGTKEADKPRFEERTGTCNGCHSGQNYGYPA